LFKSIVAVVLLAVLLAACTDTKSGQAVGGTPTAQSEAAPTSVAIPPRPKEIKLDGLDPCKLFQKAELDQIKVNRQRNKTQTEEVFKGAPICSMDGTDGKASWTYEVWLITSEGIAPWLAGTRNVDAKLVNVGGFPAVDYKFLGTTTFDCNTAVDVANGQQLSVGFRPITRDAFSQSEMCQKSEQAAGFALQNLQTLK
jgi:hypothetical protein